MVKASRVLVFPPLTVLTPAKEMMARVPLGTALFALPISRVPLANGGVLAVANAMPQGSPARSVAQRVSIV